MKTSLALALLLVLGMASVAFAGGQPSAGPKTGTTIAGPAPATFPFLVSPDQRRVSWFDGENYWWNDVRQRYERGSSWIDFNTAGGGRQYQPAGGGAPSVGSYSPAP